MRKRSGLAVVLSLTLPLALAFALAVPATEAVAAPGTADGGAAAPAERAGAGGANAGEDRHDPNNITGISRWMELCVEGNGKYLARDFPGAIASYRSAVQLAPKNPFPQYLLGAAQLASGNMVEAEASLKQAELYSDKRDAVLRAKILFMTADLKERQKKWAEAKAAWQLYSEWVFTQSNGGMFPLSSAARVKAIDDVMKLDTSMEIVRQRIAENADGNFGGAATSGADAGAKSPPAKK